MSLSGLVGGQLLMGIRMVLDARQMVSGGQQAERALIGIKKRALDADTTVSRMASNLQRSLGGIGMAATMAGAAATAAGVAMVGGFLKPSYDAARDFGNAMASMKVVTKSTNSEIAELGNLMKKTSAGTMFDPSESALAFTRLAAFTGSVSEARKNLPALQDFMAATMGEVDPEEASRTLSSAYEKFRLIVPDMRKAADIMIEAANVSPFEFRDLPQFIRSMRDVTVTANTTMEEVFALGGALRGVLSPAESGRMLAAFSSRLNQMGAAMKEYARDKGLSFAEAMITAKSDTKAKQFTRAVSELGISFYDANGNQKNFVDNTIDMLEALQRVKETMGKADFDRLIIRLLGRHSSTVMATLSTWTREGKKAGDAIRQYTKQLEKAGGTAEWARSVMEASPGGIEKKFATAATRMKISFGEPLMAMFLPIMNSLSKLMDQITAFLAKNPALAKAVGILTVSLAGLLVVMGGLTLALGTTALWISFILPTISGLGVASGASAVGVFALSAATKALFLNIAIVAGIIGLLFVAYDSYVEASGNKMESWGNKVRRMLDGISLVVRGVFEFWTGKGKNKALYDELKKKGLLGIVGSVLQAKKVIGQFISGVITGFRAALVPLGAAVFIVTYPFRMLYWALEKIMELFGIHGGFKNLKALGTTFEWLGKILGVVAAVYLVQLSAQFIAASYAGIKFGIALAAAAGPLGLLLVGVAALAAFMTTDTFWDGAVGVVSKFRIFLYNSIESLGAFMRRAAESFILYWKLIRGKITQDEFYKQLGAVAQYKGNKATYSEKLALADMSGSSMVMAQASRDVLKDTYGIDTSRLSDEEATFKESMVTEHELSRIRDTVRNRERLAAIGGQSRQKTDKWGGPAKPSVTQHINVEVKIDGSAIKDSREMVSVFQAELRKNLPKVFNSYEEIFDTP